MKPGTSWSEGNGDTTELSGRTTLFLLLLNQQKLFVIFCYITAEEILTLEEHSKLCSVNNIVIARVHGWSPRETNHRNKY